MPAMRHIKSHEDWPEPVLKLDKELLVWAGKSVPAILSMIGNGQQKLDVLGRAGNHDSF